MLYRKIRESVPRRSTVDRNTLITTDGPGPKIGSEKLQQTEIRSLPGAKGSLPKQTKEKGIDLYFR